MCRYYVAELFDMIVSTYSLWTMEFLKSQVFIEQTIIKYIKNIF